MKKPWNENNVIHNRYIDANKLKAEIERRNLSNYYVETEDYEQKLYEIIDSIQQKQPECSSSLIDVDAVREDFMTEVYRVLDADSTNDRANAIINAFDSLPTVPQERPEGGCSEKPNDLLSDPEAKERITITLSSFDIKLIYDALERERNERLSKTPWENRNPQGYPPQYSHDYNAKPVRQVDSTLRFIKRQIEQMNARKEE